jgi:uncharacterized protein (DUF4415 family)
MRTKLDNHNAETPPAQTDAQREHLAKLAAMPDETIDTSEIPEMSDEAWAAGSRGRFYRPVKQQITARVDADVLDWLKSQGRGYQGRLNAILRREFLASLKQTRGRSGTASKIKLPPWGIALSVLGAMCGCSKPPRTAKSLTDEQATNAYRLTLPPAAAKLLGHLASPPPAPEDIEHARAVQIAAVDAMVDGLPLDVQRPRLGGSCYDAYPRLRRSVTPSPAISAGSRAACIRPIGAVAHSAKKARS